MPTLRPGGTVAGELFISYSLPSRGEAQALVTALEQLGTRCWLDTTRIRDGDALGPRIINAIHEATALVAWYDEAYDDSEWCKQEVNTATSLLVTTDLGERMLIVNPCEGREHITHHEAKNRRSIVAFDRAIADVALDIHQRTAQLEGTLANPPLTYQIGNETYSEPGVVAGRLAQDWRLGRDHVRSGELEAAVYRYLRQRNRQQEVVDLKSDLDMCRADVDLALVVLTRSLDRRRVPVYRGVSVQLDALRIFLSERADGTFNEVDLVEEIFRNAALDRIVPTVGLRAIASRLDTELDRWRSLTAPWRGIPALGVVVGSEQRAAVVVLRCALDADYERETLRRADLVRRTTWWRRWWSSSPAVEGTITVGQAVAILAVHTEVRTRYRNEIRRRRAERDERRAMVIAAIRATSQFAADAAARGVVARDQIQEHVRTSDEVQSRLEDVEQEVFRSASSTLLGYQRRAAELLAALETSQRAALLHRDQAAQAPRRFALDAIAASAEQTRTEVTQNRGELMALQARAAQDLGRAHAALAEDRQSRALRVRAEHDRQLTWLQIVGAAGLVTLLIHLTLRSGVGTWIMDRRGVWPLGPAASSASFAARHRELAVTTGIAFSAVAANAVAVARRREARAPAISATYPVLGGSVVLLLLAVVREVLPVALTLLGYALEASAIAVVILILWAWLKNA